MRNIKLNAGLLVIFGIAVSAGLWWLLATYIPVLYIFAVIAVFIWIIRDLYRIAVKLVVEYNTERAKTRDAQEWTDNEA